MTLKRFNFQSGIHKEGTATLYGTSLSIDLSTGRTFEVDLQGASGNIGTFNITESLGGGKTQMFFLKIIQGAPERNFDWSTITNIKWPGGPGPS